MDKDIIKQLLQEFLDKTCIAYSELEDETLSDGIFRFNIVSDVPRYIIGRKGANLFALQHCFRLSLKKDFMESRVPVILDANDYRRHQEDNLVLLSDQKVQILKEKKEPIRLAPMPSYKRRKIHTYIAENYPDVTTESHGERDNRYVVIKLKEEKVEE